MWQLTGPACCDVASVIVHYSANLSYSAHSVCQEESSFHVQAWLLPESPESRESPVKATVKHRAKRAFEARRSEADLRTEARNWCN